MSDNESPPDKKAASTKYANHLGSVSEGLRAGLGGVDWAKVSRNLNAFNETVAAGLSKTVPAISESTGSASASASAAAESEALQPAIAGAGDGQKPQRRSPNRTSLDRIPGRRPMKEYPLSKSELWTLGGIQAGAAVSFSLAGICFGLWSSTKQQLAFAKDAHPNVAGYWQGVGDMSFYGMIGLAVIGVALFLLSGFNVLKIIWMTEHRK